MVTIFGSFHSGVIESVVFTLVQFRVQVGVY